MQLSVFVKLRSFYILQLNQLHYDWNCAKMIYVGSDLCPTTNYECKLLFGILSIYMTGKWISNTTNYGKMKWNNPRHKLNQKKISKLPKKLKMNIFVFRSFLLIFQFILDIQCFNWFNANDYFKLIKAPKATHIQADDDDDYECIFFFRWNRPRYLLIIIIAIQTELNGRHANLLLNFVNSHVFILLTVNLKRFL